MGWPWIKQRTTNGGLTAVFDLSTDSVLATIIAPTGQNGRPAAIWHHREPFQFKTDPDERRFLGRALAVFKNAVEATKRRLAGSPAENHCLLSPPFCRSTVKAISLEHDEPFQPDENLQSLIRDQDLADYTSRVSEPYLGIPDDRPYPFEYRLLDWSPINSTNNLVQHLDFISYTSLGSEAIISRLRELMTNGQGNQQIQFHSRPFLMSTIISQLLPDRQDFLLLDPAGEQTDLALTSNGRLIGQRSFRPGIRTLWRRAAHRRWQDDWPVADWLTGWQKQTSRLTKRHPLPKTVFVLADDDDDAERLADWLKPLDFQPEIIDQNSRLIILEHLANPAVAPPTNLLL